MTRHVSNIIFSQSVLLKLIPQIVCNFYRPHSQSNSGARTYHHLSSFSVARVTNRQFYRNCHWIRTQSLGAFCAKNLPKANTGVYERFCAVLNQGVISQRVRRMTDVGAVRLRIHACYAFPHAMSLPRANAGLASRIHQG